MQEKADRKISRRSRYLKAKASLGLLRWVAPDLNLIHPMGIDDPDECYHLFRQYSAMPPGFDFAHLSGYHTWYAGQDGTMAYRLHKRQLQIMQWWEPREHWVLKSPQHLGGLASLLAVYPDARIVYTHRDPKDAIASYCSLLAVVWGMISDDVDLHTVGAYALRAATHGQAVARAAIATMPKDQIIHLAFDELTADPVAVMAGVYDLFGYPSDPALNDKMQAWMQANPRNKHGRHHYDLADFGLTEKAVRDALGDDAYA